ncbi:thioredoxin family protein [Flavobacteriaceae bacterium SZ-1-7]|uniref:thioredoxin family protein n=1 Tax=Tamlana sedimenti TaxID=3134126 RepID=UPI003122E1B5
MTQTIKILGTGCPKCQLLTKATQEVVTENNLNANIEKVEDIMKIMEYNVMATPALVVNEKVVSKGRIPSKQEILEFITDESKEDTSSNKSFSCCCSSDDCC